MTDSLMYTIYIGQTASLQKFYHTMNIDQLNNASEFPHGHSLHGWTSHPHIKMFYCTVNNNDRLPHGYFSYVRFVTDRDRP